MTIEPELHRISFVGSAGFDPEGGWLVLKKNRLVARCSLLEEPSLDRVMRASVIARGGRRKESGVAHGAFASAPRLCSRRLRVGRAAIPVVVAFDDGDDFAEIRAGI